MWYIIAAIMAYGVSIALAIDFYKKQKRKWGENE